MNLDKQKKYLSKTSRLTHTWLGVLGLSLGLCASAQAQSDKEGMALEEVIVTAQKRDINLQDVPVSVNVLTGDFLEENNLNSMVEALAFTPSVTYVGGENAGVGGYVSMRGIGTNVFGFAEPTVSFVVDGVPLQSQGAGLTDLVDVERLEVLRGPQSTLFGKNASAGVISTVTRGPGEKFEASVKVLATDDNESNITGTISGPLTDNLGAMLTLYYKERDGNVYNHFSKSWINDRQSQGVRGRFDWQANDDIRVSVIGNYRDADETCCTGVLIDASATSPEKLALIDPVQPGRTNKAISNDILPVSTTEAWSLQATVDWDIGDHTLTSITSYNDSESTFALDMDGTPEFDAVWGVPDAPLFGVQTGTGSGDTTTQEFRLTSPTGDKFDYLLGFFYFDFEASSAFDRIWNLCFAPPFMPGSNCGFQQTLDQGNSGTTGSTSYSLFAHGTYHFSDSLRVVGGMRFMREEVSYEFARRNESCFIFGCSGEWDDSFTENVPMGDISLQYDLSDASMVYGKYTRGYKGQAIGLSSSFSDVQAAEQPVDGETVDAFELGFKSMLWDDRLRLNATAFFMRYEDYQAQAAEVNPSGETEFKLLNAGEIETKGIELDIQAVLAPGLILTAAATFMDAEFTDFPDAPCYPGQPIGTGSGFCNATAENPNGTQDLKGATLPAAPDVKYNISLRYDFQVDWRFRPFLQASHVYIDDQNYALNQDPTSFEPSYRLTHASAGLTDTEGRYQISVFGRNLGDETYYTAHAFGTAQRPRDIERYYGMNLRVNF